MLKRIAISVILLIACATTSIAQEQKPLPKDIDALADRFFGLLRDGKINEAYQFAFKDTASASGNSAFDKVIDQTNTVFSNYGGLLKWSVFKTVWITATVPRVVYFAELEKAPLFYEIVYYYQKDRWLISTISSDAYHSAKSKNYFSDN